jgi:hypothetical protein
VGTVLVIWLPYLLPPRPEIFAWQHNVVKVLDAKGAFASRGAFNLWWFLGMPLHNIGTPFVGPLSIQQLDVVMLGMFVGLALVGTWLDGSLDRMLVSAAVLALAFFDVGVLQYERYIFPALALLLLAALRNPRHWLSYALVSVTAFINMATNGVVYVIGQSSYLQLPPWVRGVMTDPAVTLSTATVNVFVLLLTLVLYAVTMNAPMRSPVSNAPGGEDWSSLRERRMVRPSRNLPVA